MAKQLFLTLLLTTGLFTNSLAQILNFNKGVLQNDSLKWLGQVSVFFTYINQEVSVANMGYNIDVIHKLKKHSIMAISKLNFAASDKELLLSDGYTHIRGVFFRTSKISTEIFGQIQYNAIRGLNQRSLLGAGFRLRLYDKHRYGVLFGSAIMHEWENWSNEVQAVHNKLWKNSSYLAIFGDVNSHFHFNLISYYQARFDNFFQPRVSVEVNLNLNITTKLVFTSNFTMAYDRAPVININNSTYKFKNGIGYRF